MQPRKCLGKSKNEHCLQGGEHQNTRWECSFETLNREELLKHGKNIHKRTKWRELLDNSKPDKDGIFRCVYFSSDRHHVESHFLKGQEIISPGSPTLPRQYKSPLNGTSPMNGRIKNGKRGVNWTFDGQPTFIEGTPISADIISRDMKRMKPDSALISGWFQDNQPSEAEKEGEEKGLADNFKTEDLIKNLEARLQIPHELCQQAIDKLHRQGYIIVYGLKNLKPEGWEKLALPMAIEQELKAQISASKLGSVSMGVLPHSYWPGQVGTQPLYYFPQYDPEASDEELEKEKEKVDEDPSKKENHLLPHDAVAHAMASKVLTPDKDPHIPLVQPTLSTEGNPYPLPLQSPSTQQG